jgi:mycothiol system anti-sigma-R factor
MADGTDGHDHSAGSDHDHASTPCEQALQELYVYIDGELTDEKRSTIKGHLDDCNPCFEAFDFEAELRIVISTRCRDEVPDSLRTRIAQTLAEPADHTFDV